VPLSRVFLQPYNAVGYYDTEVKMGIVNYPEDEFTQKMAELKQQVRDQQCAIDSLTAELDEMMAEYCMERMTVKQILRWNETLRKAGK